MPTKTWTGAGANELWNTALNWSGGTIPAGGDDIIFDGVAANGKKNCILNVPFSALSVTFTAGYSNTGISPFNGTFTFSQSLTIGAGGLTLGANATYLTSGTATSFTVTFTTTSTFTANGKILPTNLNVNLNATTLTFAGNADFGGNLDTAATAHTIKAAAGTTVDLRIGGNIITRAMTINPSEHVTIKGYGSGKTFASNSGTINLRLTFVNGSSYSPSASSGLAGTSSLTVEIGGQFTVPNSAHTFTNTGTVTLSGFNSSNNNSYFFGLLASGNGTIVLSNDTVIKSSITITSFTTIISSTAGAKLLLEGNFLATGGATYIIDILEFSGTTASIVSAITQLTNLQIRQFIINKTGAGSVTFSPSSTTSPFTLYIPNGQTYSWTHTSGTVTQSGNSIIQINGQSTTATFSYSTSFPAFKFSNLQIRAGKINCISQLKCVYLKLYMSGGIEFTSPALLGFTADAFVAINATNTGLSIVLKSLATYSILTELIMLGNSGGGTLALIASTLSPTTRAIFNLETTAQQLVEAVNPNSIDSSGNNGVGSPIYQTIYSVNGTLASTINWSNTVQPPPIGAKITVGYTFVN